MKTPIRSLVWNAIGFAVTSICTTVDADYGCVMIYRSDGTSYFICDIGPSLDLGPDHDGVYRITVYSGYPTDAVNPKALPKYKQSYAWKEDLPRAHVNYMNCLQDSTPITFFGLDSIGACPTYPYSGDPTPNPYYQEKIFNSESSSLNDLDNTNVEDGTASNNIFQDGIHSLSTPEEGKLGGNIAGNPIFPDADYSLFTPDEGNLGGNIAGNPIFPDADYSSFISEGGTSGGIASNPNTIPFNNDPLLLPDTTQSGTTSDFSGAALDTEDPASMIYDVTDLSVDDVA